MVSKIDSYPVGQPPVTRSDSCLAHMVRLCVFEYATRQEEEVFQSAHSFYEWLRGDRVRQIDASRLENSRKSFESIGGVFQPVEVVEGSVSSVYCDPAIIKQKIESLGGSWSQTTVQGKPVLGVTPPRDKSQAWDELFSTLSYIFSELNQAPQQTDEGKDVLVTARLQGDTPGFLQNHLDNPTCILFTNFAQPWLFHRKRFAWFLGRGFTVATYDGRGMPGQRGYV